MRKPTFQLTPEQINELQGAYQSCDETLTKIRYQAVRLYGQDYATAEVMVITGCSRTSLLKWCRRYRRYGVTGLVDQRNGGNSAKLSASEVERLRLRESPWRSESIHVECDWPPRPSPDHLPSFRAVSCQNRRSLAARRSAHTKSPFSVPLFVP